MNRLAEIFSNDHLADEVYTDAWILGFFQWLEGQMPVVTIEDGPSIEGARPAGGNIGALPYEGFVSPLPHRCLQAASPPG